MELHRGSIGIGDGELQGAVGSSALYIGRETQRADVGGHRLFNFDFEAEVAEQAFAGAGLRVGFVEQFQEGAGGERQKGAEASDGGVAGTRG